MPQLNAKQKLATLFSFTIFVLITGFSALFVFLYAFTLSSQTKKLLYTELTNISGNHLTFENEVVTFIKDKEEQSLKEHLASAGLSAIFYNKDLKMLRSYGIFVNSEVQTEIQTFVRETLQQKKVMTMNAKLPKVRTLLLSSPITNAQNETVGVMMLSQPLKLQDDAVSNLIFICMSSALISLVASFLIGHLVVREAYRELDAITKTIDEIDLNSLEQRVNAKGHPDDEVVQLAKRFNEMIDRLQQMSKRQKEFVVNASHELQTPLARIISSIETIDQPSTDLEEIKSELFTLSETINQLSLLGKVREHSAPVGSTALRQTIETIHGRLEKSSGGHTYVLRTHATILFSIQATTKSSLRILEVLPRAA